MKIFLQAAKSFLILTAFIPLIHIYSQACYNPYVEYIISQTSYDSICRYNRELTGDVETIISGQPYLIYSRRFNSPANEKAAVYIYEKFTRWGIPARFQDYSATGRNVIAVKTGSKYPGRQYIICAHYDNTVSTAVIPDTIHGADDNASGVCAVLEAARILRNYTFDYTIIFIAFDEEERGLLGSFTYADSAYARGDTILGVINLDMIAYDSDNDNVMRVGTDTNSLNIANVVFSSCRIYQPQLNPYMDWSGGGSDHYAFWYRGFKAIFLEEDQNDFNRYYHTVEDNYEHLNKPFMHAIIKTAIASLVVFEKDFIINIKHEPLVSLYDSSSRLASVIIKSNNAIAGSSNRPRLYYKTENTGYSYVNAGYVNNDTFNFIIPGFPRGTTVYYYLAVQDSAQTMIGTLPSGGMGLSPPGTAPPPELFSYHVLESMNFCSENLPKNIPPNKMVYDTIFISGSDLIYDMDLSLTILSNRDGDLYINLLHSPFYQTELSTANGGSGSNYINTVFDDEADTLITNGTPPFQGHYRPETALNKFDNSSIGGYWVLKILNLSATDTARLENWCLNFNFYNPIGIINNQVALSYSLGQNYPNPFNAQTKINYSIPKAGPVFMAVYDILGREIKVLVNEMKQQGNYNVSFDAENLPSGVYFYRMIYNDYNISKKMILIK